MRKLFLILLFFTVLLSIFEEANAFVDNQLTITTTGVAKELPDICYNPISNKYLVVWQQQNATGGMLQETETQRDARMQWWREARFGMFIHWGLYAVPAGLWKGKTHYAEQIRHRAQIPLEEYERFVSQFNPMNFDADRWVRLAKEAGMKYMVITSKHHDGFCLWDSNFTDFDIMQTPFKRDILKELKEACKRHGIVLCFYHSIMDWHHSDYLPRRPWEQAFRSTEGAEFERYTKYLKNQVRELVENYDPGVLWFDGEWEKTWTHEYGRDLYQYVRELKPDIIINNRVDKGRKGMDGLTKSDEYFGDFGTPEQQIPATGLMGMDWETCMTMNRHWGYNQSDTDCKSTEDLIRKLVDIASKGGNFLLNVGPMGDGNFPLEEIVRLKEMGRWMDENGESIYGTVASPFAGLPWGRCTRKNEGDKILLYLHVFDWPKDRKLLVPGLQNKIEQALLLTNRRILETSTTEEGIIISVPDKPLNSIVTVILLEAKGPFVIKEGK